MICSVFSLSIASFWPVANCSLRLISKYYNRLADLLERLLPAGLSIILPASYPCEGDKTAQMRKEKGKRKSTHNVLFFRGNKNKSVAADGYTS